MERKRIGDWEVKIGDKKRIQKRTVKELEDFLNKKWLPAVLEGTKSEEQWWGLRNLKIPSPIIRVEMTSLSGTSPIDNNGIKHLIYEVEMRPAGLGLFLSLSNKERIEQWKEILINANCGGFINILSSIQDDQIAANLLGFPYYQEEIPEKNSGPYWIRTNKRTGDIVNLEHISLVPIRLDGDKSYLVKLGMAEILSPDHQIDWSKPFCIKPLIGARLEGVEIYVPPMQRKKFNLKGVSTKARILKTISKGEPTLIQPFISPFGEEVNGQKGWTIWRIFFGWDFKRSQYKFVDGLWTWRPNMRVHGAADAVFGLLAITNED